MEGVHNGMLMKDDERQKMSRSHDCVTKNKQDVKERGARLGVFQVINSFHIYFVKSYRT